MSLSASVSPAKSTPPILPRCLREPSRATQILLGITQDSQEPLCGPGQTVGGLRQAVPGTRALVTLWQHRCKVTERYEDPDKRNPRGLQGKRGEFRESAAFTRLIRLRRWFATAEAAALRGDATARNAAKRDRSAVVRAGVGDRVTASP